MGLRLVCFIPVACASLGGRREENKVHKYVGWLIFGGQACEWRSAAHLEHVNHDEQPCVEALDDNLEVDTQKNLDVYVL